ncbi:DUF1622 domain-containing protein [Streptomyces sp. NBC_00105]
MGEFNKIRLSLGRFLVLGLEFQLAGDVHRRRPQPRSRMNRLTRPDADSR